MHHKRLRGWLSATLATLLMVQALLPATAFANGDLDWAVNLGGSAEADAEDVAADSNGNVFTTGFFAGGSADFDPGVGIKVLNSNGQDDIFISRLGSDGTYTQNPDWAYNIGGNSLDIGRALDVDNGDNVYVTGSFRNIVDFDPGAGTENRGVIGNGDDIFVLKLNNAGVYQWAQAISALDEQNGYDVHVSAGGDVYVSGDFRGIVDFDPSSAVTETRSSMGGFDAYLLKLNNGGDFQWVRQVSSASNVNMFGITSAGSSVYATGYSQSDTTVEPGVVLGKFGSRDVYVVKYGSDGTAQGTASIGGLGPDVGYDIASDPSGNIYVTGYFSGTVDFNPSAGGTNSLTSAGDRDAFLLKLDSNLNYVWAKRMGGSGQDEGRKVVVDSSGRAYVTGFFSSADFDPGNGVGALSATGGNNSFVSAFDTDGTYIYGKQLGAGANTTGKGLALGNQGQIYASGVFVGNGDFDPGQDTTSLQSQGSSDAFVVRLTAAGANTSPVAEDDSYNVIQGATGQPLAVLDNDSDPEDGKPTIQSVDTTNINGVVTIDAGTSLLYSTPNPAFTGVEVFDYTVVDTGGLTDTATVTVTVLANAAPTTDGKTVGVTTDTQRDITLTGSDADGDPLTFSIVTPPSNGSLSAISSTGDFTATVTYTPGSGFKGSDSFVYEVSDGKGGTAQGTVNITVADAGSAPVANDQNESVVEDTPTTITLDASDSDTGDTLTFSVVTPPSNGTLGAFSGNTVVYTPTADYNGPDSFTYEVMDTAGLTDQATVNITVTPANDMPTADDQSVGVGEDMAQLITLTGSDPDGDALTFSVVTPPSNGTLGSINITGDVTATVEYTPNPNYSGPDSFGFQVDDGNGGTATGTVSITVNPMNDAPTADAQTVEGTQGTDLTITLTGSDPDGDALEFSIITPPASGTLSAVTSVDDTSATVVYTPDTIGTQTFEFQVDDGNGGTDTAIVTINVVSGASGTEGSIFLPIIQQ